MPVIEAGIVKAFRPTSIQDIENDPSKRFDSELDPYIKRHECTSNVPFYEEYINQVRRVLSGSDPNTDKAFVKAGFDSLLEYLATRFVPTLYSLKREK